MICLSIIELLLTANPKLKIYLFTPFIRFYNKTIDDANSSDNYQIGDYKLTDFVNVVIETANKYKIPCKDLYHEIGWNKYNFQYYFTSDNHNIDYTHPWGGWQYLAEKINKFIISH